MPITEDTELPTEEELTVQEVKLSAPALKASAFHLGRACEFENHEFMLCRQELDDPRACVKEGKAVTSCALNFFQQVKRSCADEFTQYVNCIDKSSTNQRFVPCRKTQAVFDKCAQDNLGIERLPYDHYSRAHVHKALRPRPEVEPPAVYADATPHLPDDAPRPEARGGYRYIFLW